VFRNPDLARTYRLIARAAATPSTTGRSRTPSMPISSASAAGCRTTICAPHHSRVVEPLVTSYRGVDVYAMGANTQGTGHLQMLNILENFDLRAMGFQSVDPSMQVEAKRLAFEDRARYYADPQFSPRFRSSG
jgi:gamma-glutamyltranspeptidase/glutathione hydrolase